MALFNLHSLISGLRKTITTCNCLDKTLRMQFQSITLYQTTNILMSNYYLLKFTLNVFEGGQFKTPALKTNKKLYNIIFRFRCYLIQKILPLLRYHRAGPNWPRGLRRRSAAARLLKLWVRIPPGTWMFVCCECCVLSGKRSLRRVDHSSRGVPPTVVSRCV